MKSDNRSDSSINLDNGPSSSGEKVGYFSTLTATGTFLSVLIPVFSVVSAVYLFFITLYTAPSYGIITNIERGATKSSKDQPLTIIQYEVLNPGPGDLEHISLILHLNDEYDASTKTFKTGLTIEESGVGATVDIQPEKQGNGAKVVCSPKQSNGQVSLLKSGSSFSVTLISEEKMYDPKNAKVSLRGENTDSINPLETIERKNNVRLFFWWVCIFILIDFWAIIYFIRKWKSIKEKLKKETETRFILSGEMEAFALKYWMKILLDANPIQDGELASDIFEGKVKTQEELLKLLNDSKTARLENKKEPE